MGRNRKTMCSFEGTDTVEKTVWQLQFNSADMAQLAEQLICNQQVNGSSPFIGL